MGTNLNCDLGIKIFGRSLTNLRERILLFSSALTIFVGSLISYFATFNAGRILHMDLLKRVIRLPMWFFDTTPQGRILNRFSKDIDTLDNMLPWIVRILLVCLLEVSYSIVWLFLIWMDSGCTSIYHRPLIFLPHAQTNRAFRKLLAFRQGEYAMPELCCLWISLGYHSLRFMPNASIFQLLQASFRKVSGM